METQTKTCQNCKNDFTIDSEDFNFYEKIKVPPPTFCPPCRRQRRNAWRNNFSLYSRKCDLCEKNVISIYSSDSGIIVYCNKCWWSDKWDPKSYAMDYDFSKTFFEQFKELLYKIPHMAVVNDDGIASLNCEYTHDWWFSKNSYMCFSGWRVDNVLYSFYILAGKDIMDCISIRSKNEWIYECKVCSESYNLKFCEFSKNCIDSAFLSDCMNCSNCFMCYGLIGKKYFFKNKQYSKEDYEKILESYKLDTFEGLEKAKQEAYELFSNKIKRFARIYHSKNCIGDIISYSKNSKNCFNVKKLEDCRYVDYSNDNKNSYDVTMTGELEECYESVVADHSHNNFWGILSVKSQDVRYTQHCHSGKHLFGCVALKNGKYSILNKEYEKEEYQELVSKIINQMNEMPYKDKTGNVYKYGEFYPIEMSPFGYNETFANDDLPLQKEEAIDKGYKWQDNLQKTLGQETIRSGEIPESIHDVNDSILQEIFKCIDCNRNYKIIANELIFYKKMEIPIPRRCFHCRYNFRLQRMNPFKLWHRKCMKEGCLNEFETSYAPDRPEIVYCEKCYQAEIY